jgi:type II secretory pathway pseudopilin PulG
MEKRTPTCNWRLAVGSWRWLRRYAEPATGNRQPTTGAEGFTLAALIVIVTIITIIIAYTVPQQWSMIMRRERDRQTIFLMKQYARGIQRFQQKHGALPVSLDQLIEARKPRMLRGDGKWPMPLTGNPDDWIMVPPGALEGAATVTPPQNPPPPQQQTSGKLLPDASPADYIGPFVAVRPKFKGQSFISLKGADDYSEWVYTLQDLQNDILLRQAQAQVK